MRHTYADMHARTDTHPYAPARPSAYARAYTREGILGSATQYRRS